MENNQGGGGIEGLTLWSGLTPTAAAGVSLVVAAVVSVSYSSSRAAIKLVGSKIKTDTCQHVDTPIH